MIISSTEKNLLSSECVKMLRSLLPSEIADDVKTRRWWESVFYRVEGGYIYDKEYDSFLISDKGRKTFGQLLKEVVTLHLSTGIELRHKGHEQQEIIVPLCEETLSSVAYDDKTWDEVLADKEADFYINGIGMKRIRI